MKSKDFTYALPDGYVFSDEHRAKIDKVMDELGADNETAQELINIHVELLEQYVTEFHAQFETKEGEN